MEFMKKHERGSGDTSPSAPMDTAPREALRAHRAKVAHMDDLARSERARVGSLRGELGALERSKASVAVNALLGGEVADIQGVVQRIAAMRQEIEDAEAVAVELAARRQAEALQLRRLEHAVQRELGGALDEAFAAAAEHYNTFVHELAEAALELWAVQGLMIRLGVGNSNGFDGGVVLPQVRPGDGRTLAPVMRPGDRAFAEAVAQRQHALMERLRRDGFELEGM
ncbi:hypothetical protein [Thauera butanivorans]|uniref:hypothetical protein n=1 Tax=Thauera butanivorans TaxID=86174 RepID=UPI000A56BA27|nr:hypothetical protein [Thauera butanivorans]